ncbi:Nitroreductase [uncultured delta proteobacterium]|uniref:Nitroreductase n=1 Tax=uncultured delta proteobacterium TaxID=34034 RepID=A0A212K3T5_9DELT|nr:Nitroreductase [uncultured delta proteobacterium]
MNTEALKVLKERRSVRKYKPQQITDAELDAVLEAGTYAPSGKGKQPCIIIAVQNKDDIAQLSKMNAAVWGKNIDPYYGAPTILLVLSNTESSTPVEDGSAVITYLTVAAAAVGLGTCWVNRERQMFESAEGKALLQKWGVTGEYIGIAACSLGYIEGEPPKPMKRKDGYIVRVK